MKKLKTLSEGDFLKVFFAFLSLCFLVAAVCMPDRSTMFTGLGTILSSPCKISTNYFALGGYAATFLNMGLVCAISLGLFLVFKGTPNNVSTLAVILTLGFGSWGINILNIWPTIFGVMICALVKKEKFGTQVNAMLFSTGIAPLISDLLLRYPHGEAVGFNLTGLLLALVVGFLIGFFLPAGLAHSPKVHKGFDLYSAALPIGMTAFFLQAALFKTMGVDLPAAPDASTLQVASQMTANVFCLVVFGICVVAAFLLGCKPKDYWNLLTDPALVTNFSSTYGNAVFLMNVGVFGLFILGYYNLIGATFNGVTFGILFCMLATCNSGSHPGNVWPIMLGYILMSVIFGGLSSLAGGIFSKPIEEMEFSASMRYAYGLSPTQFSVVFGGISSLLGGNFAMTINAQAICVGLCYANGLSPIADKYGWQFGALAGGMHYLLVTSVPALHGGYCLYNGGFTAALICIILVPQLEKFMKTKDERRALKAE